MDSYWDAFCFENDAENSVESFQNSFIIYY